MIDEGCGKKWREGHFGGAVKCEMVNGVESQHHSQRDIPDFAMNTLRLSVSTLLTLKPSDSKLLRGVT
jgi:hypothetical protein